MPVFGATGGTSAAAATPWVASSPVGAGELRTYRGRTYTAKVSFTTGAAFDPRDWTLTNFTGINKRGVFVPAGSLDVYRARRDTAGTTRCEIVVMGDSTMYGASDPSYGPATYTPVQKIKALFNALGFADGGHGIFNTGDFDIGFFPDGDGYPTVSAKTGFASGTTSFVHGLGSNAIGDQVSESGKGTAIRLVLGRNSTASRVAYSVDGGVDTVLDLLQPLGSVTPFDSQIAYISGLTDAVHTVQVKNFALANIRPPVTFIATANRSSGGTIAVGGPYFYWATATSANGESLPVAAGSATTTAANQTIAIQLVADFGWTNVKLYRSLTNNPTTAGLVRTTTATPASTVTVIDDGSVAAGVAPPTSSTLGTLATGSKVEVWVEFLRNTGIVLHRDAVSGQSTGTFFDSFTNSASAQGGTPALLGLTSFNVTAPVNGYMDGLALAAKPANRDPALLIFQIGTNDLNGFASTDGTLTYQENLAYACRTARAAGIDVLLIAPSYTAAFAPFQHKFAGRFKTAMASVARAYGVAYCDFQEAVGFDVRSWQAKGYGTGAATAPHLGQAAYDAQAQFVWDEVLTL